MYGLEACISFKNNHVFRTVWSSIGEVDLWEWWLKSKWSKKFGSLRYKHIESFGWNQTRCQCREFDDRFWFYSCSIYLWGLWRWRRILQWYFHIKNALMNMPRLEFIILILYIIIWKLFLSRSIFGKHRNCFQLIATRYKVDTSYRR